MQKLALRVLPLALVFVATAAAAQRSELTLQVADIDGNELGPVSLVFTSPEGEVLAAATKKNGKLKIRLKPADAPYKLLLRMEAIRTRRESSTSARAATLPSPSGSSTKPR